MLHPVYSAAAVRSADAHTISTLGVPSLALMETAGRALAQIALARFPEAVAQGVQIVCGRGNNGGDGYVAARLLHQAGHPVRVLAMSGAHSPDGALCRRAAQGVGVNIDEGGGLRPGRGLVIDAVLGTGLSAEVRGTARNAIEAINQSRCPVLSADIPSGLCGDTGQVMGVAVRAQATATFGFAKLGLLLEPGADYTGELTVVDIGLVSNTGPALHIPDGAWVASQLPQRAPASHKGDHGHLAVVAGSIDKTGAAQLVCEAALRSGCGLVTLFIDPGALPRLGRLPPEVMLRLLAAPSPADLASFSAVAVGPGFGVEHERALVLRHLWAKLPVPAVFDADGLTALGERPSPPLFPRGITPHPKEAARLLGWTVAQVQADRLGALQGLSQIAPTLLKGRHTLCSAATPRLNRSGGPQLAIGGSGDVLTGLVGGLLARGLAVETALIVGAYLHGRAGELAGEGPILATEIAGRLPEAMRGLGEARGVLRVWPLL